MERTQDYRHLHILESGGAELDPQPNGAALIYMGGAFGTVYAVSQISIAGLLVFVPFYAVNNYLKRRAEKEAEIELLAFYARVTEPIFEFQLDPTDAEVFNRAERHRELLAESGNKLFKQGKISVEEVYYRDVQFDYCEKFEEFLERRLDIRRDKLREWSRTVAPNDPMWVKKNLYGQKIGRLNGKEVLAA